MDSSSLPTAHFIIIDAIITGAMVFAGLIVISVMIGACIVGK